MVRELNKGSQRLMSAYLHTMLSYPDAVHKGERPIDHTTGEPISNIPPLDPDCTYPKETELIRLVNEEKRPGQRQPVRVHFLTYQQSLQSDGLRLAAQKALNSMAVEGEIPEEGLSAYAEGDENVYVSLAKQIVNNLHLTDSSADELRTAFTRQRAWQDQQEQPLVDPDQWRLPDPDQPAPAPSQRREPRPETPEKMPEPAHVASNGQLSMFSLEQFARQPASAQ